MEKGGFLSRKMRNDHLEHYHTQSKFPTHDMLKTGDKVALRQLCFDLVKADDVAGIEDFAAAGLLTIEIYHKGLMKCASQHASSGVIHVLTSRAKSISEMAIHTDIRVAFAQSYEELFLAAMAGNNSDAFQGLLRSNFIFAYGRHSLDQHRQGLVAVLTNGNDEFVDMCRTFIEQDSLKNKRSYLHTQSLIAGAEYREDVLLGLWKQLSRQIWMTKPWKFTLRDVGATTCSIKLAQFLLDQGIEVDERESSSSRTPLHEAVRQNTAKGAELARFLLFNGAKHNANQKIGNREIGDRVWCIRDEPGARQMSKWLGVSWDELVAQAEEKGQQMNSLQ